MQVGILIDDKGRRWPDCSWEVARRIRYRHPTLDLANFAVRERGFIHIRQQQAGVRVALHANAFRLETLGGALYEVKESGARRIILALFANGEWFYELLTGIWEFAARAEQLIAGGPIEPRYLWIAAERDLAALALPTFARLRPLVEMWRSCRGRIPSQIDASLDRLGLWQRAILVRQPLCSSRLVFAQVGDGIECVRPGQSALLIDRDVHDQLDQEYGSWVARCYAENLASRRPRLQSIRATVRLSETTVAQGRYDRLTLPWSNSRNEPLLMSISLTRSHRCLNDGPGQVSQQRVGLHPN
jgi:hypothetical protein